jgi:hypothetical protein
MAHANLSFPRGLAFALSVLAVCASMTLGTRNASAQEPSVVEEEDTLHLGAPLDKGEDKGKPPSNPPYTPDSGPGTVAALALAAGAGYWTLRRTMPGKAYVAARK